MFNMLKFYKYIRVFLIYQTDHNKKYRPEQGPNMILQVIKLLCKKEIFTFGLMQCADLQMKIGKNHEKGFQKVLNKKSDLASFDPPQEIILNQII